MYNIYNDNTLEVNVPNLKSAYINLDATLRDNTDVFEPNEIITVSFLQELQPVDLGEAVVSAAGTSTAAAGASINVDFDSLSVAFNANDGTVLLPPGVYQNVANISLQRLSGTGDRYLAIVPHYNGFYDISCGIGEVSGSTQPFTLSCNGIIEVPVGGSAIVGLGLVYIHPSGGNLSDYAIGNIKWSIVQIAEY
jgi:hypothetical protein